MCKSLFIIGFFTFLTAFVYAQEPRQDTSLHRIWEAGLPYITQYTPEDYKASIQNWGFIQDDDGIMYVANSSGVMEFDGVSWRLIKLPNGSKVNGLVKGDDGIIYVAGIRELGYLAPDSLGSLQFRSLLLQLDTAYHNFATLWNTFTLNDAIYFIYAEYIFKWDGKKFKIWEPPRFFIGGHLVNDQIFIETLDKGVMRLEADSLRLIIKENREERVGISFMLPYDDQIWMVYRRHGEMLYNHQQALPFDITGKDLLRNKHPYKAAQLPNGDYVIATLGHGAFIIDTSGRIKYNFIKATGISSNVIHNVYVDREGAIWLATNKGINRIEIASPLRFFNHLHGLSENIEKVVMHQGQLYAGTHDGLYFLHKNPINSDIEKPYFKRVDGIQGIIWAIASVGNDLLLANSANLFRVDEENRTQLIKFGGDSFVQLLRPKKDSTIIYVGSSRGNIYPLNTQGHQWTLGDPYLKVEGNICQMVENPDGSWWVGTRYNGIYHVDLPVKKSKNSIEKGAMIKRYDTAHGLPEIKEVPICRTGIKTYFSTDYKIFYFDSLHQKFVPDTLLMGQLNPLATEIGTLTAIKNGGLWVAAASDFKNSVFKYEDGNVEEIIPYRRFHGFDIYSIYDTHEGMVFFSGPKGIIAYNQHMNQEKYISYPLHIRKVSNAHDSLLFAGHPSKQMVSTSAQLPFTENALRFAYALPSYDKPEANQYQYFLEGFDVGWSSWTTETQRDFTNLSEGTYRFRVRGQNVYGNISEEAVYTFTILPPWYRTWWAYLLYTLAFAGFVSIVVQWRSAQLRREKEVLENIVKERTQQLEQQAGKLKEMDQMKSRLFANISHEFRTPLTLIKGPVTELMKSKQENLRLSDAQMIDRNADRLLRLVNQLLDLSKLDAGNLALEAETGDIYQFLRALAAAFSSHAEQRRMTYSIVIPQEGLNTSFDHDKLEKIVYNLLSNAFKFTSDEGSVTIKATDNKRLLKLTIIDNGQGIAQEHLLHIFDRFYQTDNSPTREQEGTGIGLSLTKELVSLMGGEIKVESVPGKGAVFTVILPMTLVDIGKESNENNTAIAETVSGDSISKEEAVLTDLPHLQEAPMVLIVEDNADMRHFIKAQLNPDYKVLEASHGQAGLEIAQHEIPDLIITDLMMPEMDGMELCAQLKTDERTSHIPIIMLTAKSGQEHKIEGLETGADDYLTKPFDRQELEVRVKNLIVQRQQLRERFSREITLEPRQIAITSLDEQFLQKVRELLENNLADTAFGMAEMQAALAMSKTQLYRKIKALTDQSPGEFIRNYRLKRAAQILAQQGDNVTQVAYAVGFNNLSYFAKCFKEMYNVAPSEYKSSAHS